MQLSSFGRKLTAKSGILQLMDDLGKAMAHAPRGVQGKTGTKKMRMLGGGNPAHIPEMEQIWRTRMQQILENKGEFEHMLGDQSPPYYLHKAEGAFFLWLWCKDFPITAQELYERLKNRGVLVVPGHYFFPGLQKPWKHTTECIRITYSQAEEDVKEGLRIIAEEIGNAYD